MSETTLEEAIETIAQMIVESQRCVVFTGAGVSTESGIPDFRSPGGIWSKYNPEDFTYQKFMSSEKHRKMRWDRVRETYDTFMVDPNPAHHAIVALEAMGKLDCIITQNVDNLHQKAGSERVIELHGTALWVLCLDCDARFPLNEIKKRLDAGEEIPECEKCSGMLKVATISFGQPMPEKETREATERSKNSDLFIVVGSSLVVQPAALMPIYAKQAGGRLVIINMGPTPHDDYADIIIRMKAGEVLPKVVEKVKETIAH